MEETESPVLWKILAPYLGGAVLASTLVTLGLLGYSRAHAPAGAIPHAVTFDIVRYSNAQRAVASAFMKKGSDISEASDLLLNLSERSRAAIAEVAGPGTVVLMKQAVIQGVDGDITEEVLKKLGLPLQVPTQDAAAYTLDVAPTMLLDPPQSRKDSPVPLVGKNVVP